MTIARKLMRQSRMQDNSRYGFIPFEGGLDLTTQPILIKPGYLLDTQNFEIGVGGRYERIEGYERLDGRPSPSDAQYSIVYVTITGSIEVDDTVTGATSGATGKVIAISDDADYLVLTRVTGDFQDSETLNVSGSPEATTDSEGLGAAAPTLKEHADYKYLASQDYRADIQAVPGAGAVRGVFQLGDDKFAVRDNAGQSEAVLHKATSGGWTAVDLGSEIGFDGGTAAFEEGETVTGGTSGATATVERVVLESGDWSNSDGAGRLILSGVTGDFEDDETLTGGSSSGSATADGADSAITLLPGGRYRTARFNFYGSSGSVRIYGCDGVNRGFEFDGSVYVPINTGMEDDTPDHVICHKYHLFFAFGASVQHSGTGTPYIWSPVFGASEISMGDTVTGFNVEYGYQTGATLAIFARNSIHMLYGNDDGDWQLVAYRSEIGAFPDSIQNVGATFAVDDWGIRTLKSADSFGNFTDAAISKLIQPFIIARKNRVTGSCVVREKSQYRVFFEDDTAIYLTMKEGKVSGFMTQALDHTVECIDSSETASGAESMLFGSDDGYVYQLDRGTSFDGEAIEAHLQLHFVNFKSSRLIKRYRAASVEATGLGYAEFDLAYELAYNSIERHQPGWSTEEVEFISSRWDEFTWDQFYWDGQSVYPNDTPLAGSAENISFIIRINSAKYNPVKFSGINTRYSPRRYKR